MYTRRSFIEMLGTGAVAGALSAFGRPQQAGPSALIALQLYSVRDHLETDLQGTLARVADLGIRYVETAFWPNEISVRSASRLLADTSLEVISAHVELPFGDEKDRMLEAADAYDCTRMVWHGWPEDERYATVDGVYELAEEYNEANRFANENGLQLYLHNHWWEFEHVDGQLPFYMLLEQLDSGIMFEIDIWWTHVAGQDPARVPRDFGARAPLLHIKDGAVISTEGPMVAVGQGLLDVPVIAAAGTGFTEYMIIEIDECETDMFTAIEQSHMFLADNNLALAASSE